MSVSESIRLLLLLLFFLASASSDQDSNRRTLLLLKSRLRISDPTRLDSWSPASPPCHFSGITCDSTGSVTAIDLSSSGLIGPLPLDTVCSLPSLQKLAFGSNSLSGPVDPSIGNCTGLLHLDLAFNFFSGTAPDVSQLTKLRVLNLSSNGLSGDFPWPALASLSDLTVLSLGDNPLRPSRFPMEILGLRRLSVIYLSNCSLTGEIPPAIGYLTELERLELSHNRLSGEFPPEVRRLAKLKILEIYENMLTGKFPPGFGNLTALEFLDASTNFLEGEVAELRSLTSLVSLQIFNNSFSGEIPSEFGQFQRLVNLSLYGNSFSGSLPEALGSWSEFDYIDVSDNQLTGRIPPFMCQRGTMRQLLMVNNRLSGKVPDSYSDCLSLERIRVSGNNLSGEVPAKIWSLPNVKLLDLASNNLQGPISPEIRRAVNLGSLFIADNNFSGELPPEISAATELVQIHAQNNAFSGRIPLEIKELKKLISLYLQNNQLSGEIPHEMGFCSALNQINLAGNSLFGEIPSSLGGLRWLNSLNLSDNQLAGRVPESLAALKLSQLDLTNNRLSGQVPESFCNEAYSRSFLGNPGLCSLTATNLRPCSEDTGKSSQIRTIIACFAAGSAFLFASLGFFIISRKLRSTGAGGSDLNRSIKSGSWRLKPFQVLTFTEEEILAGIQNENLIGKGGSGDVYRVLLRDGTAVAVKHIWRSAGRASGAAGTAMLGGRKAVSPEFEAEVAALSSVRHVNVVKLFCSVTSEDSSLLVYEYLPRGNLWDRIHTSEDKAGLEWVTRYEIAVGSARGLEYLHHGCGRPIIHRDVKSSNILLDDFFKPRIADFGLAKIIQAQSGSESSHIIPGTYGYIAPEYGYTYKVTEKSDVYSFGVVLMELVTGKRPVEADFGESKDIVGWVSSAMRSRESILSLVDLRILDSCKEDAAKVLRIAIICTARLPVMRPSMRTVVQMLEEVGQLRLFREDSVVNLKGGREPCRTSLSE